MLGGMFQDENFDRMNLECNSLRGTGTYKGHGYETISIRKYVISLKSKTQTVMDTLS